MCSAWMAVWGGVPYKSRWRKLLAAPGGHVSRTISTVGQIGSHIKLGANARALILFDEKRSPNLPELPTAKGGDMTS